MAGTAEAETGVAPVIAGLSILWAVGVLLVHWFAGAFACGTDTSYCAQTRHKDHVISGTLVGHDGHVVRDTAFTVSFGSRERERRRDVGGFSTDHDGRYCIVWARDSGGFVRFDGGTAQLTEPWRPLNGSDPPPGCRAGDAGIPWRRASDLTSAPQYLAVVFLAVAGGLLAALSLLLRPALAVRRAAAAGAVLVLTSTLLAVLVWSL